MLFAIDIINSYWCWGFIMLSEINYEEIMIIGISAGMTMGIVTTLLSSFITAFKVLIKDVSDV